MAPLALTLIRIQETIRSAALEMALVPPKMAHWTHFQGNHHAPQYVKDSPKFISYR